MYVQNAEKLLRCASFFYKMADFQLFLVRSSGASGQETALYTHYINVVQNYFRVLNARRSFSLVSGFMEIRERPILVLDFASDCYDNAICHQHIIDQLDQLRTVIAKTFSVMIIVESITRCARSLRTYNTMIRGGHSVLVTGSMDDEPYAGFYSTNFEAMHRPSEKASRLIAASKVDPNTMSENRSGTAKYRISYPMEVIDVIRQRGVPRTYDGAIKTSDRICDKYHAACLVSIMFGPITPQIDIDTAIAKSIEFLQHPVTLRSGTPRKDVIVTFFSLATSIYEFSVMPFLGAAQLLATKFATCMSIGPSFSISTYLREVRRVIETIEEETYVMLADTCPATDADWTRDLYRTGIATRLMERFNGAEAVLLPALDPLTSFVLTDNNIADIAWAFRELIDVLKIISLVPFHLAVFHIRRLSLYSEPSHPWDMIHRTDIGASRPFKHVNPDFRFDARMNITQSVECYGSAPIETLCISGKIVDIANFTFVTMACHVFQKLYLPNLLLAKHGIKRPSGI